jgi:hypothetical protein
MCVILMDGSGAQGGSRDALGLKGVVEKLSGGGGGGCNGRQKEKKKKLVKKSLVSHNPSPANYLHHRDLGPRNAAAQECI